MKTCLSCRWEPYWEGDAKSQLGTCEMPWPSNSCAGMGFYKDTIHLKKHGKGWRLFIRGMTFKCKAWEAKP